ncbi:MAG: substrate-binding domain-containing protein [Desulfobacterales bacterium]|nr:substrate-binding domain-containing protein [Desulfobacterales bacterium]
MVEERLPLIPAERADDLHHLEDAKDADLVLFMAGNQFMAMEELLAAFQRRHPAVKKIFYETLPPGLELKQILAGGARFAGEVLAIQPDVYTSVRRRAMETLVRKGLLTPESYRPYLRNRLTLMVPAGNPAKITAVSDLAKPEVRISQPDPENEDIARHILRMYEDAGGPALVRRIMEEKRAEGTTVPTVVHHRETPLRIGMKTVDVGPVWATEAVHARSTGLAFEVVEPGGRLDQRDRIQYYACRLDRAPHRQAAAAFVDFLLDPEAQDIFERYGFVRYANG